MKPKAIDVADFCEDCRELVTRCACETEPEAPAEPCAFCGRDCPTVAHWLYCSAICAIDAERS